MQEKPAGVQEKALLERGARADAPAPQRSARSARAAGYAGMSVGEVPHPGWGRWPRAWGKVTGKFGARPESLAAEMLRSKSVLPRSPGGADPGEPGTRCGRRQGALPPAHRPRS